MDFALTKEQEAIKKFVKDFCIREVLPIAEKIEEESKIPDELIQKITQFRLFGIPFAKEYGGSGSNYQTSTIVLEELARYCGAVSMLVGVNYLTSIPIDLFGTEEQKLKFITPLATGKAIGSFAFTEAGTGSDPRSITTKAVRDGDNYIINGAKRFITASDKDGIIVFFAKEGDSVSAFIGSKNVPGYTVPKPWEKVGMHGVALTDIIFENYVLPKENLLGASGNGYNILLDTISLGKLDSAALVLGCAEAAMDEAVKYAKERMVKGKPMTQFQTTQCLLSEIVTLIESARLMLYRLAWLADQKKNIRAESAMTKVYVTEAAMEATHKAFKIHGAYAYVKEFRIQQLLRDVSLGEIVEGSNEFQKIIHAQSIIK
ncbi:MAG: acyl-CoA dehydrogenase family protein [Dehalococcoidales bacterium]|nr:acyl-CoA dehydrogenase family protein [Dehalococcoidales bacterium]